MKRNILYSIFLILALVSKYSYAQTEPFKGYRIEGEELIFSFDKRDYEKATTDHHGSILDFEDLDIQNVVVSGKFNNWSKYKWKMTKVDENKYELRKKLSDFTDEFSWEFKFVINNAYWAEPSKRDGNAVRAYKNGYRLRSYNLKFYTAYPDKNGNITFTLNGYDTARKVILSGSFNKWNEDLFRMTKNEDCWTLTLKIRPGEYQYKFIVDGDWIEDPDNPRKTINEFSGYNSLIDIKAPAKFILNGFLDAQQVIIAGSFNNWSEGEYKMTRTKNGWADTLMLSGGKHHYKFIVDGKWMEDPDNPVKEYDFKGNVNSVCMVK
ncbi:glycogen-binding domain-containing protein [Aquimarina sp. AU119]|uniref:glycogen-binding domain-containing protein n=1 Tax=Aquimarina sp. AU119 TaxID=2108528 RepID=UPI000D69BEFE|nr:glycogen-binding domain-containing protein [Aquimarina sp. AU119]